VSAIRFLLEVYRAKFRAEIALQFAYRGALLIWLLGLVVQPVVYLVVWRTVAASQGGSVGGFSAADFAAYFVAVMVVNQLTFTWHFFEMEWRVRNGLFSPLLLRPVHPVHNDVTENLTFKLLTSTVVIPVAIGLVVVFDATLSVTPASLLAFLPALLMAMALRFIVEWTLALTAFWVTRMAAINEAYYVAMLFLSGQVAPLAFFPAPVQLIAAVLPFRWMVSFPVETLLGRLSALEIAVGYAVQAVWIGIALLLMRVAWRAGVRRYSAVGA
jgi:ABC-2 type transport system permease protein